MLMNGLILNDKLFPYFVFLLFVKSKETVKSQVSNN